MTVANRVIANQPIAQGGAHGYLLWVRRDLPPVYSALTKQYPAVASFESALQRQAAGLGDDESFDESDLSIDTSSFDYGAPAVDPVVLPDFDLPAIEAPIITVDAPEIPPVAISSDASGAAGTVASSIGPSTLQSIASTVAAILPSALNTATALVNQQSVAKNLQTAQLQYAAAVAGRAPLQTGVVTTSSGSQYLAALDPTGSLSAVGDTLDTNIAGLPLWAWGVIGLGALMLAVKAAED